MTNTGGTRKSLVHRFATIMAAVGALLVSSGIVLMVTPTSANAGDTSDRQTKDWVCKYVGTPGVDEHLKKGNDGLVWVSTHATQGTWFNDAQGRSFVLLADAPHSPRPSSDQCPAPEQGDLTTTASLNVTDPSCQNGNVASFTVTAEHADLSWVKVNGEKIEATLGVPVAVQPGDSIQAKLHADQHFTFDLGDGQTAKTVTLDDTVGVVEVNCTAVTPAAPTFTDPTCTTAGAVTLPTSTTVTYAQVGTASAGATVNVTATLVDPETSHFLAGVPTTWSHTFATPSGCTGVLPPTTTVSPPKSPSQVKGETTTTTTTTTTPTVVEAGLAGETRGSGDADLGLVAVGLLLLTGAGGLVLREGGRRTAAA